MWMKGALQYICDLTGQSDPKSLTGKSLTGSQARPVEGLSLP